MQNTKTDLCSDEFFLLPIKTLHHTSTTTVVWNSMLRRLDGIADKLQKLLPDWEINAVTVQFHITLLWFFFKCFRFPDGVFITTSKTHFIQTLH